MSKVDVRLLNAAEVADILRIHERHVWRMISRGDIPRVKIGRRTLIDAADVETFIRERKGASS